MDKWIEVSLKTWYPKDDPKHLDPLHPAMGLAGEAGELIDTWKKHLFKPGYDAWDCVECGHSHYVAPICGCGCPVKVPIILDELGDLTYYARILFYQVNSELPEPYIMTDDVLSHLVGINRDTARLLELINRKTSMNKVCEVKLNSIWRKIVSLCRRLNTDLEAVLEMNKIKLLESEDNHGWKNAV